MALLDIKNLTFSYDGSYEKIFEDVSFQIDTNWKLGFVGRNGRGKTTFLNLLLGKFEYGGMISSKVDFKYFPYAIKDKTLNAIDIVASLYPDFELWQLERELSLLEVDEEVLYRPFETLSNGERTKVMLASLFLDDDGFLLIDEPTNHLDLEGRKTISKYLKSKKGFILVSHDRKLLDECTDHTLSINKTNIEIQKGNFSSWFYNKQLQDEYELSENEKIKREMKRLDKSAKNAAMRSSKIEGDKYGMGPVDRGYIGHKSAKMMKSAKNIEHRHTNLMEEKSKLLKNIESAEDLKIKQLKHHSTNLFALEDIELFFGDKKVFENVSFEIKQGERIAIRGKNGCGKSSLLKFIRGENIDYKGNLYKSGNPVISYVSQDTSFLEGTLDNFAQKNKIDETLFKTILRKLDFSRSQFEKTMENFSEGQKKKVLIARSLCEEAHLYVWDEPLNFIDVMSRIQIENLLIEFKPTIIFVEHDETFTNNVATNVITLVKTP